jgi:hypothetical protein
MPKIKPGGVYEIKLVDKYYVYVCEMYEYCFGLFDFVSETPAELENIEKLKFRDYMNSKRTGIVKKVWEKIGTIDLIKNNMKVPDRAVWYEWNEELSYKNCLIVRNGLHIKVTLNEYKKILENGFKTGVFDNYINYEDYIVKHLINNKLIQVDEEIRAIWYRKRKKEAYPKYYK